jgi:hypothetical protein
MADVRNFAGRTNCGDAGQAHDNEIGFVSAMVGMRGTIANKKAQP